MRGFAILAGAVLAATSLAASAGDTGPVAAEPALAAPAIDPARLEAAKTTVDLVFPPGTYARMMKGSLDPMLGSVTDSMGVLMPYDIAAQTGASSEELEKLDKAVLAEVQAIYDPHSRERIESGMRAMMEQMGGLMSQIEPDVRQGLQRAYARRFDLKQLRELNGFFTTPTGKAYAEQSLMIFLDPEIMQTMQKSMPLMMEQMPAMTKAAENAAAKFPKARKTCDLTKEELAQVIKLLQIKDFPSNYCNPTPVDYAQ